MARAQKQVRWRGYRENFKRRGFTKRHAEGGVLNYGDSRVTDRFFLGSALMRGFEPGGIGPREIVDEGEVINDALGGNTFAVLRLEAEFSLGLLKNMGSMVGYSLM